MTNDLEKEEAVLLTGEFLGVGAAGVALAWGAQNPYVVGLAAFVPTLGAIAMKSAVRRLSKMWDGFKGCAGSEEAARARVNTAADAAAVQDAVLETFRRVQEALDPDVLFALGRLLWLYTSEASKPDRFFRNAGQLLTGVESQELRDIAGMLLSVIVRAQETDQTAIVSLVAGIRDSDGTYGVGFVAEMGSNMQRSGRVLFATGTGAHLFSLLKRNGFGFDEDRWGAGASESFAIHIDDAARLLDVIASPTQ